MSTRENRRAKRRPLNLLLESYDPEGLVMTGLCRMLDISATGGLLESAVKLELGQRVRLNFRLGGYKHLEMMVRVVRVLTRGSKKLYGVEFSEEKPKSLDSLRDAA